MANPQPSIIITDVVEAAKRLETTGIDVGIELNEQVGIELNECHHDSLNHKGAKLVWTPRGPD